MPRAVGLEERYVAAVPPTRLGVTPAEFAAVAARALAEKPPPVVDVSHLQPVRMTVREAAGMVVDELNRAGGRVTFRELTAGCRHRVEVVVHFLALLELYKIDVVELHQTASFDVLTVVANRAASADVAGMFAGMEEYAAVPVASDGKHGDPDGAQAAVTGD